MSEIESKLRPHLKRKGVQFARAPEGEATQVHVNLQGSDRKIIFLDLRQ